MRVCLQQVCVGLRASRSCAKPAAAAAVYVARGSRARANPSALALRAAPAAAPGGGGAIFAAAGGPRVTMGLSWSTPAKRQPAEGEPSSKRARVETKAASEPGPVAGHTPELSTAPEPPKPVYVPKHSILVAPTDDTLETVFEKHGFSAEQVALIKQRNPEVVTYSLENEIIPRLNFLEYLYEKGDQFQEGETVPMYVTRQPFCLERKLQVVYQDERYLALRKPFYVRHDTPQWPSRSPGDVPRYEIKYNGDTSAEDWAQSQVESGVKVRFCHQIDFATEGILLCAKTKKDAGNASKNFKTRDNKKTYLAIVFGHPEQDKWLADHPIIQDETDPKGFRMRVAAAHEVGDTKGKESQTEVEVLARGYIALEGAYKGKPASKVLLRPLTGRRHQIRVHLQKSGFPILGDSAYSDDTDSHRMFLLAHTLYVPLPERPLDVHLAEPVAWKRALTIPDASPEPDTKCACGIVFDGVTVAT